eukprot:GHVQ01009162.1.p1 GENE.GHVQ01009162.1~~GHVQ01009162.1.p1  ORF type:complete len:195 (+),score=20.49 GHVQ01009162.1:463-1047(+)
MTDKGGLIAISDTEAESMCTNTHQNGTPGGTAVTVSQFECLQSEARKAERVRVKVGEEEELKQLRERDKYLKLAKFSDFNPRNEKEFEVWVDESASVVSRIRLGLPVFQELWVGVSSPMYGKIVGGIHGCSSYEELGDSVALELFPRSEYVIDVENSLLKGCRRDRVIEARFWMRESAFRYVQLCRRRNRPLVL